MRDPKFVKNEPFKAVGTASWYGHEAGKRTANGERFKPSKMTAAHRTLPFGTIVKVTNLENGKHVRVRINDRGPAYYTNRIIDVSKKAAKKLGFKKEGLARVKLKVVRKPCHRRLNAFIGDCLKITCKLDKRG